VAPGARGVAVPTPQTGRARRPANFALLDLEKLEREGKSRLRHVVAERALDFLGIQTLAVIEAPQQGSDNFLGFILAKVLDETVEKMLSGQRVIDLALFVVVLEFGKVTDPVLLGVLGLPINLEHDLIGFKQHILGA
jgi:hypothetical protein